MLPAWGPGKRSISIVWRRLDASSIKREKPFKLKTRSRWELARAEARSSLLRTNAPRCYIEEMGTTVDLPEGLLRQLKAQAALEGTSLKQLVLTPEFDTLELFSAISRSDVVSNQ